MGHLDKLPNQNKSKTQFNAKGCVSVLALILITIIAADKCSDKKPPVTDTSYTAIEASRSKDVEQKSAPENKVDQDAVKELKQYFFLKKDEFDSSGKVWVEPKNRPKYRNANSVYCYFQKDDDTPSNFRLVIQYAADDWLFISNYTFNVDGIVFDYYPDGIERDNNSTIWEWSDNSVTATDISLINALSSAKKAKVKFNGKQYSKVRVLTKNEIAYIKRTVRFYRALGGSF